MALDSPSWLADDDEDAAFTTPSPVTTVPTSSRLTADGDIRGADPNATAAGNMLHSSGAATSPAPASDAPDETDLPKVVLLMRLANLGAAGALIAVSIMVMAGLPGISTWVLSVYAACGGILICCLETQLKFLRVAIALNFGFLFSAFFRFLFYLLLAAISWTYGKIFGPIVAGGMVVVACFNTYVLCRYPTYRKVREKIAEEEDKRIEAKISGEVQKQVIGRTFGR